MIEIAQTQRKLREARFFLRHLDNLAQTVIGDNEEFRFYLSAFLSASRSVTFVLQKEWGKPNYELAFNLWKGTLADSENQLLQFMNDKRVEEVHLTGVPTQTEKKAIPIYDRYEDKSGRMEVFAPPPIFMSGPPAEVIKRAWHFVASDGNMEVVPTCSNYLGLIERFLEAVQSQTHEAQLQAELTAGQSSIS